MFHPFADSVARCWMLLRVVAQSVKPVKLFSQQLPTLLLFHDRRSVAQQCWICLHSSSNIVGATHAFYTWFQRLMGCMLPTMHCRSQHCWELLHLFAHHCKHAQQCWELLRPFARSLRRMFIIFSVFFLNTSTKGWTLFFWISTVITMHLSTLRVTANRNWTFVHVWRSSLT